MRILAIRGKNLASLAGEFVVDFQQQPLEGAGVFAISGPTGAGKSTLLDAMCLALYHDTPRLLGAHANNVNVPDVGDYSLPPQDPRNLLRRGCVEGYAEVDFIDHDGHPRCASWHVRRARGKPGGKMQAASASLRRIDTDVVESTAARETREKIEACIGLSFDQFRRAVLLAQNDFATLLKAGNNERADLLEALTNTSIFSKLSTLAYKRHASEQAAVDQLQQQLNVLATLPADERGQLDAEVTASDALCKQLALALTTLLDEQHWHQRGQQLQEQCAKAEQERGRQQQAIDADRPQRQQLQRWNAIAPLCPLWDNRLGVRGELQAVQDSLPGLDAAITQTEAAEAAAKTALSTAQDAFTEAQRQHHDAQPVLLAARQMDGAIRQQQTQQNGQQQALIKAQDDHRELEKAIRATRQQQQDLQTAVDTWPQWQQEHPALGEDDATWPAVGEGLRKAHEQQQQATQARDDISQLQSRELTAQGELDALKKVADNADAGMTAAQAKLQACTDTCAALDPVSLPGRQKALRNNTQRVEKFAAAIAALSATQTQHSEAAAELAHQQEKLASDEATISTARDDANAADAAAAAAHTAFEHASLAADQITERLREELQPGEPCLVCGAREHPLAHAPRAGVDKLLKTLRRQRDDTQQARDDARAGHQRAITEFSATQRAVNAATTALAAATARVQRVHTDAQQAARVVDGIGEVAAVQDDNGLTRLLLTTQAELEQQTAQLEQSSTQISQAEQALERARKAVEHERGQTEQCRKNLQAAKDQLAPIAANLRTRQALFDSSESALQQTLQHLQQYSGNPALELSQLDSLGADWNAGELIRAAAAAARTPLAACGSTVQAQQQHLQALAGEIAESQLVIAALDHELTQARKLRQRTLVDPDVEACAQRLQKAESEAGAHAAALLDAHHQAAKLHDAAVADRQSAVDRSAELTLRLDEATRQLLDQLARQPHVPGTASLSLDALAPLIDSLPDDLDQRNAAWQQRDQALIGAKAGLATLTRQLGEWQAEATSTRSADEVTSEQTTIAQQHAAAIEIQADLRARQREDQHRHEQAAEHLSHIEILTAQVRRWQQLNVLIGSAGGDKFKTYAQQFTLDVLLDYANQHLARLAPRYQLRRGSELLTLLVVDGDFADEVRSVHSLSGGESFLVSLALALGLASLSSERVKVESLFIDEGFGSLDTDTLNMAMEALDRLQSEGRRVGVISHVHDMAERIGVQIKVRPVAPGKSVVETVG